MATTANLRNEPTGVITGNDNIAIVNHFDGIRGGRTLDVTGYPEKVLHAGHVIIKEVKNDVETYKPMPLNENGTEYKENEITAIEESGSTKSYTGFLIASIPVDRPFAAIMTSGTINPKAVPFSIDSIMDELKKQLPLIDYQED